MVRIMLYIKMKVNAKSTQVTSNECGSVHMCVSGPRVPILSLKCLIVLEQVQHLPTHEQNRQKGHMDTLVQGHVTENRAYPRIKQDFDVAVSEGISFICIRNSWQPAFKKHHVPCGKMTAWHICSQKILCFTVFCLFNLDSKYWYLFLPWKY